MAAAAKIEDPVYFLKFLLGGRAVFTLKSIPTGTSFTFAVSKKKNVDYFYVSVLTSPDIYTNIGNVFLGDYYQDEEMRIGIDAKSRKTFEWLWRQLVAKNLDRLGDVEVWHQGRCSMCSRTLTDPESIRLGIGPVCRTKT